MRRIRDLGLEAGYLAARQRHDRSTDGDGERGFVPTGWDSTGTHVVSNKNENPRFTGALGADDGTRTHDLLHGKCERAFAPVRARSRPFAQTARLQGFPYKRANGTEPERTPNLAILATERLEAQRL